MIVRCFAVMFPDAVFTYPKILPHTHVEKALQPKIEIKMVISLHFGEQAEFTVTVFQRWE